MNFLQLLTSGASILNFNFQSKGSHSIETVSKSMNKAQGFQKLSNHIGNVDNFGNVPNSLINEPSTLLTQMLQNQRQQLINRYLQLNIHLLEGKIQEQSSIQKKSEFQNLKESLFQKEDKQSADKLHNSKKKIKKDVKCGHEDKPHYAKGLCNNCYHKYGRTKKPWNCPHDKLYAGGMCQNCYINLYNKKKREEIVGPDEKEQFFDEIKKETLILNAEMHKQENEILEQEEKIQQN